MKHLAAGRESVEDDAEAGAEVGEVEDAGGDGRGVEEEVDSEAIDVKMVRDEGDGRGERRGVSEAWRAGPGERIVEDPGVRWRMG